MSECRLAPRYYAVAIYSLKIGVVISRGVARRGRTHGRVERGWLAEKKRDRDRERDRMREEEGERERENKRDDDGGGGSGMLAD